MTGIFIKRRVVRQTRKYIRLITCAGEWERVKECFPDRRSGGLVCYAARALQVVVSSRS